MGKIAGKSYSLRAVRDQVQRNREEVIARRLRARANFREHKVDGLWFGAKIHDLEIVGYEPIYAKEKQPCGKFTKLLLSKAGIDPDSVSCEGMASKILKAIGRRRYQKLPEISRLAPLAESRGVDDPFIWKVSERELRSIYAQ